MNRRIALKNALMIVGGAALIPRQLRGVGGPSIRLAKLKLTALDETLLASLVDTLIPATDTPGAKALKVHLFVMKMVEDCHDEAEQRIFTEGLRQVDRYSTKRFGQDFVGCRQIEQVGILEGLKVKSGVSAELWGFNRLLRKRAIQGYMESQYVMTHLIPHRMIPEKYDGYYPASNYES